MSNTILNILVASACANSIAGRPNLDYSDMDIDRAVPRPYPTGRTMKWMQSTPSPVKTWNG
jgi:hypothetical protein